MRLRGSSNHRESLPVDRRSVLLLGAAGAAGGLAAVFRERLEECLHGATEANAFVDRFPERLPGAARIRTLRAPRARHCLVHVRQVHDTPQNTPAQDANVRAVQADITRTLSAMMDHDGVRLRKVYAENMRTPEQIDAESSAAIVSPLTPEQAAVLMEGNARAAARLREELRDPGLPADMREQKRLMLARLNSAQRDIHLQARDPERLRLERQHAIHAMNAAFRLRSERGLDVVPGEEPGAADAAYREVQRHARPGYREIPPEARDEVFRMRETGLLSLIAASGDAVGTAVYGGAHDFRAAIAEWNRLHPDRAFSLVEITPEALAMLERR